MSNIARTAILRWSLALATVAGVLFSTPALEGIAAEATASRAAGAHAPGAQMAPVHPLAILPPILAISLALASGKLLLSLGLAILAGALLATGFNPIAATSRIVVDYGWGATFSDPSKLWIFVFTTTLLGTVGVIVRAGGIQGIVERLAKVAKGPRSAQAATFLMGLCVFFDDYANSILVGTTMRPLTDRMRVSREKLAYLVDSTAAPIAGVAVISTWIGYEVGLLGDAASGIGLSLDGYGIFFASLPFRFYCLFTLLFIPVLIWSGRDFGPMAKAERRAAGGEVLREGATLLGSAHLDDLQAEEGIPKDPLVALLPIGLILFGTILGLLWDGGGLALVAASPRALFSFSTWSLSFGASDSTRVLGVATLVGAGAAFALAVGRRLLSPSQALQAFFKGARAMGIALLVLALAWGLKAACDDVGTSEFLVASLAGTLDPRALPMLIFLLAGAVAFSTGTSWGTMGILIPVALPLAYALGGQEGMFLASAAVLDGAVFGDHISPISDTTVISSIASGSDHLDHVRTQLPYATLTMGVALVFGYGWNGLGLPYALTWVLGPGLLFAVLFTVGKKAHQPAASAAPGFSP